jgi:hypothetical protein
MKTHYLLTDGMGRSAAGIRVVLEKYPAIRNAFHSPDNRQVIFIGKKQLIWSNYGIFQGDAHIYEIEHFPGSLGVSGNVRSVQRNLIMREHPKNVKYPPEEQRKKMEEK